MVLLWWGWGEISYNRFVSVTGLGPLQTSHAVLPSTWYLSQAHRTDRQGRSRWPCIVKLSRLLIFSDKFCNWLVFIFWRKNQAEIWRSPFIVLSVLPFQSSFYQALDSYLWTIRYHERAVTVTWAFAESCYATITYASGRSALAFAYEFGNKWGLVIIPAIG